MSGSGSFGVNYKKSYGTDPAIIPAKLGDIGSDPDGAWMFVKASAAVAQYAFVYIVDAYTVAETAAASTIVQHVGVAQVALAINEYGWVWIGGAGGGGTGKGIKGKILGSYVANTPLLVTVTAGTADDTGTATTIKNVSATTLTTGAASVELKSTGYLTVN